MNTDNNENLPMEAVSYTFTVKVEGKVQMPFGEKVDLTTSTAVRVAAMQHIEQRPDGGVNKSTNLYLRMSTESLEPFLPKTTFELADNFYLTSLHKPGSSLTVPFNCASVANMNRHTICAVFSFEKESLRGSQGGMWCGVEPLPIFSDNLVSLVVKTFLEDLMQKHSPEKEIDIRLAQSHCDVKTGVSTWVNNLDVTTHNIFKEALLFGHTDIGGVLFTYADICNSYRELGLIMKPLMFPLNVSVKLSYNAFRKLYIPFEPEETT